MLGTPVSPNVIWNEYPCLRIPISFERNSGVYIICINENDEVWFPIYIGESNDIVASLEQHRQDFDFWQYVTKYANEIHIIKESDYENRKKIEKELICYWNPPRNKKNRCGPCNSYFQNKIPDLYQT